MKVFIWCVIFSSMAASALFAGIFNLVTGGDEVLSVILFCASAMYMDLRLKNDSI